LETPVLLGSILRVVTLPVALAVGMAGLGAILAAGAAVVLAVRLSQ
jgi:hypothetical protein